MAYFGCVSAVIFDLDGTLLDTERATAGVLKDFLARYGKVLDAEKEEKRLGKMHKESAATIVEDYELPFSGDEFSRAIMPFYQERWPHAKALPGANRLMMHLHRHGIPLALASNSIKKHIEMKISHQRGWKDYFSVIIGGDEVPHGKPSPDIFLEAAERLGVDAARCLVIEDSPVGVRAAKASGAKVVAVPSLQNQPQHYTIANCVLHSLLEFQPELWGLPAFEDWIEKALPIEPFLVKGLVSEILHQDGSSLVKITSDGGAYEYIPDQAPGVFFGWAKLKKQELFKVVVSIGWDASSCPATRVVQLHFIDEIPIHAEEQMHLLCVGYIRNLKNQGDMSVALKIQKQDLEVAMAAIDLPMFSHHISMLEKGAFASPNSICVVEGED